MNCLQSSETNLRKATKIKICCIEGSQELRMEDVWKSQESSKNWPTGQTEPSGRNVFVREVTMNLKVTLSVSTHYLWSSTRACRWTNSTATLSFMAEWPEASLALHDI